MTNDTLPGFAGTCGQSSDSADKLRTEIKPKPKRITVHFKDVGRDSLSWSKTFTAGITTGHIAREAKRGGRLASNGVEAELNDGGSAGSIIVSGWRAVGTFTVEQS